MSDSPDAEYVGDEEFLDICGGDRGVSRMLRMQLVELSKGKGGEVLAEMAKEILTGRVGVREAIRTTGYEEELVSGIESFKSRWDSLSAEERKSAEEAGGEMLRGLREEE